jgi:hypothetical protein
LKERLIRFAVVSSILASFCLVAKADDKKDIEALYARLSKYIKDNKSDAILDLETPDFKAKTIDGKTKTGKELAEQMKMEGAHEKVKKFDIKIASMKIRGKSASVDTTFDVISEIVDAEGMMGPKGKKHKMSGTGAIHNELVKTKDGWKCKALEEKAMKMTMDGKPFDPSKMGAGAPKK